MDITELPFYSPEPLATKTARTFPISNLIDEIADDRNISDSFDYVVGHLENAEQREHLKPKRSEYCKRLKELLYSGTFRITKKDFRTLEVTDGPKKRIVQAPTVFHRIGCHAIMVPFERYTYATLIKNTAASIKGRGMHWLHKIIEEDLMADPEGMQYYYQCDILGYYDHISQELMKSQIRKYVNDTVVLPMLDNFIGLLDKGLSKGLRSSQCFANLHLSEIDHKMCELVSSHKITDTDTVVGVVGKGNGKVVINGQEIRYHYYRYCDDIVMFASNKKALWLLSRYLKQLLSELGLTIKPSETVRPISVGLDYLGYVTFADDSRQKRVVYSRIRKRTKQKFARRISKVKSRKRRISLIGSFFGMAAHADCKHLLKKLITPSEYKKLKYNRNMNDFGNFKVKPSTLDGKKNFKGRVVYPQDVDRQGVIILDFERDVIPRREREEYSKRLQTAAIQGVAGEFVEKPKSKYVISLILHGAVCKLWTGDREIWQILDQMEEEEVLPMFVGISVDYSGKYKKLNFVSASSLNLHTPTDQEFEAILKRCNINL